MTRPRRSDLTAVGTPGGVVRRRHGPGVRRSVDRPGTAWLSVVLLALVLPACSRDLRQPARCCPPAGGRIEELDVAPGRDGRTLAVWGAVGEGGAANIVLSRFDPRSGAWKLPRHVQPSPGTAVAGRQVGPRIVSLPGGAMAVGWVDRARDPAGDIYVAFSPDGGETFREPRRVNDDEESMAGQEYHDLVALPDGRLAAVWLDERDAPESDENRKEVYFAETRDRSARFGPNRRLTTSPAGVCPCCRPAVAAAPDGTLHVIFRDREGDRLFPRVASRPAGREDFAPPVTLSGGWEYPACPVNGPAIAAAPGGRVWALWVEGGAEGETLWWSRSEDGGRSFSPRRQLTPGADAEGELAALPARVHLTVLSPRRAVALWEDSRGRIACALLPGAEGDGESVAAALLTGDGERIARSPAAVAASPRTVDLFWIEEDPLAALGGATGSTEVAYPLHRRIVLTEPDGTVVSASRSRLPRSF